MNRHSATFALAAVIALGQAAYGQVGAQPAPSPAPAAAPAARAAAAAHSAVIDVGYIFKNHARFKQAMDKMKDEVLQAENALKAERDRINGLMEQLKGFNVGTPEYKKLEAEVAKAQGDFSVNAQLQKKEFMDLEAKLYLQVYSEIERAVSQFARDNGIAVVHRFDGDPVDATDRNRILGSITKAIVYYDPQIDITPDVLRMLNGAAVAGAATSQSRPLR